MSEHKQFTIDTGIQVHFAHPGSPWERGASENTNGLIRQYFPKGAVFDKVSVREIKRVQREPNDRPRAVLHYKKPDEVINQLIALKVWNHQHNKTPKIWKFRHEKNYAKGLLFMQVFLSIFPKFPIWEQIYSVNRQMSQITHGPKNRKKKRFKPRDIKRKTNPKKKQKENKKWLKIMKGLCVGHKKRRDSFCCHKI